MCIFLKYFIKKKNYYFINYITFTTVSCKYVLKEIL